MYIFSSTSNLLAILFYVIRKYNVMSQFDSLIYNKMY